MSDLKANDVVETGNEKTQNEAWPKLIPQGPTQWIATTFLFFAYVIAVGYIKVQHLYRVLTP